MKTTVKYFVLVAFSLLPLCAQSSSATPELRLGGILPVKYTLTAPPASPTLRPASLPLVFEPNRGQAAAGVRYLARTGSFMILITDRETIFAKQDTEPVHLHFGTGVTSPRVIEPMEPTGGASNYLIGNDPAKWRTGIPHYRRVRVRDVYPGIDEVFYGEGGRLEFDFVVSPGADPALISLDYGPNRSLRLDDTGNLRSATSDGSELLLHRPTVYQVGENGHRMEIASSFRLTGRNRSTFALARYDRKRELIIDPSVSYATFLGGSLYNTGYAIAVDSASNAYVAGQTMSTSFPVNNPLPGNGGVNQGAGGADAFVSKINASGTALIYSTYLGGSLTDIASGIAIDSTGVATIAGTTNSKDFPVQNPLQATLKGGNDAFIVKLNPAGNGFVFSTYFGGSRDENVGGMATDPSGNVYITGQTASTDFPTKNPFQSPTFSPFINLFAAKVSADGSSVVYADYLGGGNSDSANAVAADASGNAYIVGRASPGNLPVKTPLVASPSGNIQAFILKITPTGSGLVYGTFFGGGNDASGNAITVDGQGQAYITGYTSSSDFQTKNALFPNFQGTPQSGFVSKINAAGSAFVFSTYLAATVGSGIAIDGSGNVFVTGANQNRAFPLQNAIQPGIIGSDMFITIFNADGAGLSFSTNLGGLDSGNGIALDAGGNAYITGAISSTASFPVSSSSVQSSLKGLTDAFILKLSGVSNPVATVSAASFLPNISVTPNSIAAAFGNNLATQTASASGTLGTSLGGTTVNVTDANNVTTPAQLFFASPGQVNFLVPAGIAIGKGQVQIIAGDGTISVGPLQLVNIAPGIFTADGTVPVGSILQIDAQGNQTYTNLAQYNSATGKFSATPINLGPASTQTFLIIYGTGIRNAPLSQISVSVGGQTATPAFAGIQGTFAGLDQVNLGIPHSLAGTGDVAISLTAGGITSNPVHVTVQ
jgi:uncharacterized protein (TIGR03437 family)